MGIALFIWSANVSAFWRKPSATINGAANQLDPAGEISRCSLYIPEYICIFFVCEGEGQSLHQGHIFKRTKKMKAIKSPGQQQQVIKKNYIMVHCLLRK